MATPLDDSSYLTSSSSSSSSSLSPSSSSGVSRASRRISTSSTSSIEEDGWTLSERLLLAAAVQQCGIEHCDWNTVSTAMQARASAGRPRDLFSAERCGNLYVKLLGIDLEKERENQGLSTLGVINNRDRRKKIPPLLGAKPDDLSRVAEELRQARIQELRNSIHNTENSIKRLQEDIATLKTGSLDNWLDTERKTTMIAWEKAQAEGPRKQVKQEEEGGDTIKKEKEEEEPEEENKRKKAKSSSPRPSRSRSRRGTSPNAPGSPPFSPSSSTSSTGISSPSPLALSSSSVPSTSPSTSSLVALSSPNGFTSPAGSVVTRRQSPRGPVKGATPFTPSSLPAGTTPLTSSTEDVGAGGRKRKRPSSTSAPFSPPVMTRGEREKEKELRSSSASVGSEESSSSSSSVSADTPKDKKELLKLLRTITSHKNASIFKEPVNPEEAPDYEQVIKKPMDLSTLKKKIETGTVTTLTEFFCDVILMLQNAMIYNAKGSAIYKMSANLKQFVLSLMKPHFPSMEEAEESSTTSSSSSAKSTAASRRKSRKRDEDEDSS